MSRALTKLAGQVLPRPSSGAWRLWALALVAGVAVGFAVVVFRTMIDLGSFVAFGAARGRLAERLIDLDWARRLIGPIVGGAIIALLLRFGVSQGWGPSPRPFGVQDVIAARRLRGTIRATTLSLRDGFLSALISVVSLGWGGSSGREAPAMHLGATLAILPGRLFGLDLAARRLLLAMGVAAAFAAVLHAPIAGVLIARELIVPRLRFLALGPVVLAAFSSWRVAEWAYDGAPVLAIPDAGAIPPEFHMAVLALAPVLGVVGWLAALTWAHAPGVAERMANRVRIPVWLLPVFGGAALGVLAVGFPLVIGVGYEPLTAGLGGQYSVVLMVVLAIMKIAAASLTFAGRWGGGPIAPALYVGAMVGAASGAMIGLFLGEQATAQVYFGVIGMAVCLAVLLDAPFAAALLALELSSRPEIGAGALAASLIACFVVRSFAPQPNLEDQIDRTLRWR